MITEYVTLEGCTIHSMFFKPDTASPTTVDVYFKVGATVIMSGADNRSDDGKYMVKEVKVEGEKSKVVLEKKQ